MFSSLVWLFPEYRRVVLENQNLIALNQALSHQIANGPVDMSRLMDDYSNKVLQEDPFIDGKVPDELWLTPGDDR